MAFDSIHFAAEDSPEQCPYCDGPITREKLIAIHDRIRDEAAQQLDQYKSEIEEQSRLKLEAFEKSAQTKADAQANARIAEATKARDAAIQEAAQVRAGAAEAQQSAIDLSLASARSSWESEKAQQLSERAADEERVRAGLRQQIDELANSKQETESRISTLEAERNSALAAEKAAQQQLDAAKQAGIEAARAEQAEVLAERDAKLKLAEDREARLAKERDDASRVAEERAAQLVAEREESARRAEQAARDADKMRAKAIEAEVTTVREILRADHEREMLEKAAEAGRDREGLLRKISDLQRQVENKPADELGDGAEINLFEKLRDHFPDDRITRIGKGEPGADIRVAVLHKGVVAGTVLLDSKNRKAWQESFATKLHADKIAAEADYAILSSTAFPKDKKALCVVADIIVTRPTHVCDMVTILRDHLVKLHVRGLSNEKRAEKREALFQLITSEQFRQRLAEADNLREQLEKLDVEEQEVHSRTWKKRGQMLRRQHHALSGTTMEIDAIVEGDTPTDLGW